MQFLTSYLSLFSSSPRQVGCMIVLFVSRFRFVCMCVDGVEIGMGSQAYI